MTRLGFQLLMHLGKSVGGLTRKATVEKCWSYSYLQDLNSRNKLITQYYSLLMTKCHCLQLSVWFLYFKAPNSAVQ